MSYPFEGVLLQDPVVFSGTVRDNLDPFGASAGDGAIWAALRQTGMAEIITQLVSMAGHHQKQSWWFTYCPIVTAFSLSVCPADLYVARFWQ